MTRTAISLAKLRLYLCLSIITLAALPIHAQTLYLPVQYQFGCYGEIYYGGQSPAQWAYIQGPASQYAAPAIAPLLARFNFPSPENHPTQFNIQVSTYLPARQVFTDLLPYAEAGRLGFTPNDARNEAYLNVPRNQTAAPANSEPTPSAPATPAASKPEPPNPAKAIPLLNWAKAEHARGQHPDLVLLLLREAAKYDPAAAARLQASFK